jgi:alkylated DNA repair dioxygenase AlkB
LLFLALVKGPRGVGGAKHKDRPERVPRAHRDVVVFGGAHRHRLWVGLVCSR